MKRILGRIWRLTWLAASGPQAWKGLVVYAVVLGLGFVSIWTSVMMIAWTERFYDAVEQLDLPATLRELGVFFALVGAQAAAFIVADYLRKRLLLRWRARLTDRALDVWTGNRAYWHLRPGQTPRPVDNPDQRVAEDCRLFIEKLLMLSIDLIENCVSIVSYLVVLWGLTAFVLSFSLGGVEISMSRYLVWLAFLYVALSSLITHLMGRELKPLYFGQEKREADFRHTLVQLRDNATEISQSGGEAAELRRLRGRFGAIRANWLGLIRREAILNIFYRPYFQTILRVPLFFSLPAYFAGFVTFGGLMQLSGAFGRVTQTLSWFIFNYKALADIAAVSERLDDLFASAGDPDPMPEAPREIVHRTCENGTVRLRDLVLFTPQGRALDPVPDTTVSPGEVVWLRGPSGIGKSTLVAALSGLWRYGRGEIWRPEAQMLFLPQKPYLVSDGLAEAASYPKEPAAFGADRIREVLTEVGLTHRLPLLDIAGPAAMEGLSMGERQRLALARVLLNRPEWIVLDEATSALDHDSEQHILALIRRELPKATILCVAHDVPKGLGQHRLLELGAETSDERKTA